MRSKELEYELNQVWNLLYLCNIYCSSSFDEIIIRFIKLKKNNVVDIEIVYPWIIVYL